MPSWLIIVIVFALGFAVTAIVAEWLVRRSKQRAS